MQKRKEIEATVKIFSSRSFINDQISERIEEVEEKEEADSGIFSHKYHQSEEMKEGAVV